MKIFQIGSSLDDEDKSNDIDLLIVSNKAVDICLYTEEEWKQFEQTKVTPHGHRVVICPPARKIFPLAKRLLKKVEE